MIYPFIAGRCSDLPVVACCRVMKVSVSGFYQWQHRQTHPAPQVVADRELTKTITEIWRQSRGVYGSPRVWAELRLGQGILVSPQTGGKVDAAGGDRRDLPAPPAGLHPQKPRRHPRR
ncbi:MAG: IS3 family transposase [Acidimicrobiia bacterium]